MYNKSALPLMHFIPAEFRSLQLHENAGTMHKQALVAVSNQKS
jgi:hypothetical protein